MRSIGLTQTLFDTVTFRHRHFSTQTLFDTDTWKPLAKRGLLFLYSTTIDDVSILFGAGIEF